MPNAETKNKKKEENFQNDMDIFGIILQSTLWWGDEEK
mgnify:CR=1 FL=1